MLTCSPPARLHHSMSDLPAAACLILRTLSLPDFMSQGRIVNRIQSNTPIHISCLPSSICINIPINPSRMESEHV
ncbi:hypothetical protein BDU57DRAFT_510398 [Ampelomyces quisqualis]|uniref:Uncharacterized protein n=1 Tax=Ampelomyces quisqualis TaxID=50730 RepID=A0A6A5R2B8_AMPQU|nr:hypothetical protein BDU57DRAFT_510398 [Ampelomyces quisqualis]